MHSAYSASSTDSQSRFLTKILFLRWTIFNNSPKEPLNSAPHDEARSPKHKSKNHNYRAVSLNSETGKGLEKYLGKHRKTLRWKELQHSWRMVQSVPCLPQKNINWISHILLKESWRSMRSIILSKLSRAMLKNTPEDDCPKNEGKDAP